MDPKIVVVSPPFLFGIWDVDGGDLIFWTFIKAEALK
jgi:hypothetical protein